jgi:DNA-binding NtrC family response regulator
MATYVLQNRLMQNRPMQDGPINENVVLLMGSDRDWMGSDRDCHPALNAVAADFGWTVEVASDLNSVAAAQTHRTTVALFFCHDALGPNYSRLETIHLIRAALPQVRLVVCHGFSETIDWPELSDAGAFHELWLPLQENEVRLCLGFVREDQKRIAAAAVTDISAARAAKTMRDLEVLDDITAGRSRGFRATSARTIR